MPYSRAPIAEAVIDLHLVFPQPPTIEQLEGFARSLKEKFPQMQRINAIAFAVGAHQATGAVSSETNSVPLGVRLTNATGDRVLQLRTQGWSYSHLAPYTEWETFLGEMKSLWEQFQRKFAPESTSRLAVRYINRITLKQGIDLDLYLNLTPRLLTTVCPDVEGYFLQLVLPQRDLGPEYMAIVNTGLDGPIPPDSMSVLLDVDLYCQKTVPLDGDEMWKILAKLRDRKNEIFEASITDLSLIHI